MIPRERKRAWRSSFVGGPRTPFLDADKEVLRLALQQNGLLEPAYDAERLFDAVVVIVDLCRRAMDEERRLTIKGWRREITEFRHFLKQADAAPDQSRSLRIDTHLTRALANVRGRSIVADGQNGSIERQEVSEVLADLQAVLASLPIVGKCRLPENYLFLLAVKLRLLLLQQTSAILSYTRDSYYERFLRELARAVDGKEREYMHQTARRALEEPI